VEVYNDLKSKNVVVDYLVNKPDLELMVSSVKNPAFP
jgi:hypothetical protein